MACELPKNKTEGAKRARGLKELSELDLVRRNVERKPFAYQIADYWRRRP